MPTDAPPRPRTRPTRAEIRDSLLPLRLLGAGPWAMHAYACQRWPCERFTVVADKYVMQLDPDPHLPATLVF